MQHRELARFERYLSQRRYSVNTIRTYVNALRVFSEYLGTTPLSEVRNEHVELFNTDYILKNGYSASYQNQVINAIKLYYKWFHNASLDIACIERPIEGFKLPVVLSLREVERILKVTGNLKHRTMLMLLYSCGLRRSELLRLTVRDIDSHRMIIRINNSKGKKDRLVPFTAQRVYKKY